MSVSPSSTSGFKQKAQHDIASPPAQRPHSSPTARRIVQPGSIQALLRDHCRVRLYVPPIAWTSKQLRLLNCQFVLQDGRRTRPAPLNSGLHDDGSSAAGGVAQRKLGRTTRAATYLTRTGTLTTKNPKCLAFYFDCRPVARVSSDLVFSSNSVTPSLAYITFDKIQSLRKRHVHVLSSKKINAPVLRIRQKKLNSLEPQNLAEDPYIVGILIALAQEQRWLREQQQGLQGQDTDVITSNQVEEVPAVITSSVAKSSCSFKVQVLALQGIAAGALYVYTANIPSEFLDKFEEPSRFSPSSPLVITYDIIPLGRSTMLHKLHRLLCFGSCSFCSSCNETQEVCAAN
ncbi:uncharacterized protein TRUGW13939_08298 [Talaromyces rugulosus]|uniref:Uncharacterized protein n=1 Tax=Talaromyces rugulosus TaxID=121627 RepID=A0A7H8R614_TALRU|nr:uncharacterized protein TRUGW13939_08298 [Talaromyces rugulosus]QKX61151.1 hypothetical protein TRUGW13939_08298 [Talaromyces rugulosus]